MSDSDWKDDEHSEWVDDKHHAATDPLVSGVRQFVQGASGNFSDELAGLVEGAGRAVGVHGAGGPMKNISMDPDGPTMDWETLRDAYRRGRNLERGSLKQDAIDNPATSATANIIGSIASPINKLAKGMSLLKGGATIGGISALGGSDAEDIPQMALDTAAGAGMGAALGKGAERASPYVAKGVQSAGGLIKSAAEGLAKNATGATGKQASEFAPNAGRELLDRGLVRFGDNAGNVANRTRAAMNDANSAIDSSLKALDAKGVTASADNIVQELQSKIAELEKDPSQAGIVRKLKGIVDDIIQTGESKVPLSAAEQTKRGFNKAAGNWMDPEAGQAGKTAYGAYRGEVEKAAEAAEPELAAKFQEGKKTYGLLAPIEEAASRRANTVNQSPIGGLGDMAAAGAGAVTGGVIGAPLGVAAKKILAPRLASSGAVTADKISKLLMKSPQMAELYSKNPQVFNAIAQKMEGRISASAPKAAENDKLPTFDKEAIIEKTQGTKYSQPLQNAAQRGAQAFGAAHFILQSQDPDYRKLTTQDEDQHKEEQDGFE